MLSNPNKLLVTKTTVWKKEPVPSGQLAASDKATLKQGTTFTIAATSKAPDGHLKVTLGENLTIQGRNTGYLFKGHVLLSKATPEEIRLDVPFFAQVAIPGEPSSLPVKIQNRICNTSSCAAVAKFLGAPIKGDEDYLRFVNKFGDTTDHSAQTEALAEIGIKSTWHTDLSFADLDNALAKGLPVVIGILHRGTDQNPEGGHMITCIGSVGEGEERNYIFNDPFGSLNDGYTQKAENGDGVIYSREDLEDRWTAEGYGTGWGRLFYGNR